MKTLIDTAPIAEMTIANVMPAARSEQMTLKAPNDAAHGAASRPYILARRSARWARRITYA
jgi:hypothetical protein